MDENQTNWKPFSTAAQRRLFNQTDELYIGRPSALWRIDDVR